MILAIESSCDDSSIAVVKTTSLECVFYEKITQNEHSEFGGVVPELASRLHTEALPKILEKCKVFFSDLKAIAVTSEPGLSVSLQSGVAMAKALSVALDLPLIAVNHLKGHICSLFLDSEIKNDFLCLLVSGGHTMLLEIDKNYQIIPLVNTTDDSFGESFDKCAKMLGLGYPGGVFVEEKARQVAGFNPLNFSIPLRDKTRFEYSFSGIKNQVRLAVQKASEEGNLDAKTRLICKSFQDVAIAHIVDKLKLVLQKKSFKFLGVVGGASANLALRNELNAITQKSDMQLLTAPLKYCSDNALMIARAAILQYQKQDFVNVGDDIIHPKSINFRSLR